MISKVVIHSDAFLDMPLTSQALYFHLNLEADDDGFVNSPNRVMRTIGANKNDMQLLIAKRFVLSFDSGVIVIKHWLLHNTIQSDRYTATTHISEKRQLTQKENKSYTEANKELKTPLETKCIQNGNNMETQYRLDKVSKDKINKDIEQKTDNIELIFSSFWSAYPRKVGKQKCLNWFKSRNVDYDFLDILLDAIELQKQSKQWQEEKGKYIPHPYTWLNRGGWEDELEMEETPEDIWLPFVNDEN